MTGDRRARLAAASLVSMLLLSAQAEDERPVRDRMLVGEPEAGRAAVAAYGCGVCHRIPGVPGAIGIVGPPLEGVGARALIAGTLPNRPEVLTRFVKNPPALVPGTGMPALEMTEQEARHIAAYLATLR